MRRAQDPLPKDDRRSVGRRRRGAARALCGRGVHRRHALGVRARVSARRDHPRGGAAGDAAASRRPPRAVSVPGRGDSVRGDAGAPRTPAQCRFLPRRDPGPLRGDPHVPQDDGQGGGRDVRADRAHGAGGARAPGGLDGAPLVVLRPGVAMEVLGARRRAEPGAPAAPLLRERRPAALEIVFPETSRGLVARGAAERAHARVRDVRERRGRSRREREVPRGSVRPSPVREERRGERRGTNANARSPTRSPK